VYGAKAKPVRRIAMAVPKSKLLGFFLTAAMSSDLVRVVPSAKVMIISCTWLHGEHH